MASPSPLPSLSARSLPTGPLAQEPGGERGTGQGGAWHHCPFPLVPSQHGHAARWGLLWRRGWKAMEGERSLQGVKQQ